MKLLMENWRNFVSQTEQGLLNEKKDRRRKFADDKGLDEEKEGDDPCWDNYEQVGMKKKGGKEVPNCVPKQKESLELDEDVEIVGEEKKPCKPSKGKKFAKRVDGKCRSYGQSGKAKDGGDRIRPGTSKGDAYCARSAKIKKCKEPPCANDLSRKKWKCRGDKSIAEEVKDKYGTEVEDRNKASLKQGVADLDEVYSDKQRKWACAQTGKSRKNFSGKPPLSKSEADEMCSGPMKK